MSKSLNYDHQSNSLQAQKIKKKLKKSSDQSFARTKGAEKRSLWIL